MGIKGKEAGVIFSIIPKHYSTGPRDVKFSVKCIFKTKLQLKDDKNQNKDDKNDKNKKKNEKDKQNQNPLIDTELPYILDFELGPPKTPDLDTSNTPSSSAKSGNQSNENQ